MKLFTPSIAWPLGIVGVFFVSLTVCGVTITLASSDPTGGVEEGYYAKAVAWDDIAAEQRASDALGWSASVLAGAELSVIRVDLTDAAGEAIAGRTGTAFVFHHAARTEAVEVPIVADVAVPGRYVVSLPSDRAGLWQLRLRVEHGGDVFLHTEDVSVGRMVGGS